jgi:hypothetical protein
VTQATLNVMAKDVAGQDKQNMYMFSNSCFELLAISFPIGTRGSTTYQVSPYGDASCVIATGGNGATLTVQVSKVNNGMGR